MPADHARLLGYLIGDGYVGGKTPISFINRSDELHADVASIASTLGCTVGRRGRQGIEAAISHRPGERNGVRPGPRGRHLGHLAWEKVILAPSLLT